MVLTRAAWLCLAACSLGCVPKVAPQRLDQRASIAVAFVVDPAHQGQPGPAPEVLKRKVFELLDSRNLEPKEVELARLGGQTLTGQRFSALRAAVPDAPFAMLVETRVTFFAQIEGRYRWTVSVKLTVARQGAEPVQDSFDMPALMQFEHERSDDALVDTSGSLLTRLTPLLDGVLVRSQPDGGTASRSPNPGSIYFVMVDRFANGDRANDGDADPTDPQGFHGGDLQGLREHLDWLQALHVQTVWLSPVFAMRTAKYGPYGGYHGYWVEDLTRVEPRFGDEALLRALADELHARGMRLMLDVVLNHAAPDGQLVKQRPEWFHRQGGITDWNDPVQLVTYDVHGLPDFAQERPEVFDYLLQSSTGWLERAHVDGFRLDAVKHLPLEFWARYNTELLKHGGPGFDRLGELLDGDAAAVAQTWAEGRFTEMFDFPLRYAMVDVFCRAQSPAKLAATLTDDRRYPDPAGLVTLLDNHDLPRVMTECGGDPARVEQALKFMLTARGVPSLIWGTEVGFQGAKEPDNRASMRFEQGAPLKALIGALLEARQRHPALQAGAPMVLLARGDALAVLRVSPTQAALTVLNRTGAPLTVAVPAELGQASWADAVTGVAAPQSFGPGVTTRVASADLAALAVRVDAQWRTGARRRTVEISARGAPPGEALLAVGSGPELGGWKPGQGLKLPARAELPVGGVFELKLVAHAGAGAPHWEPGHNRVLVVEAGTGPLKLELNWGDT